MSKAKVALKRFDPADYLTSDVAVAEYLNAAAQGGDTAHIARALADVVRARNLSQLSRDTGLTRAGVRKALGEAGNPSFGTVAKILEAVGVGIAFRPLAPPAKVVKRGKAA